MSQGQALRLVRVSLLNQLSQGRVTYVDLCLIRDLLRGVTTDWIQQDLCDSDSLVMKDVNKSATSNGVMLMCFILLHSLIKK